MKKNKLIFIFIISSVISINSFSQQATIDSLKQIIAIAKQDTNKVQTLIELGDKYKFTNSDTAFYYYEKALVLSEKINDKKFIAKAIRAKGLAYAIKGDLDIALESFTKALELNKEVGYKKGIAYNLGNIGIVYYFRGDYNKAMEYWQKTIKIKESIGDKEGVAADLSNIGLIYMFQGNYDKSLEYYKRSLKLDQEINSKEGVAINYVNIGSIYMQTGDYKQAIENYENSLKLYEEIQAMDGISTSTGNLGILYSLLGDNNKAIEYYEKALKIAEDIGDKKGIVANLGNISGLSIQEGDYNKAIDLSNRGLELSKQTAMVNDMQINYNNLSKAYWALNQNKEASSNLNEFIEIDNKNILINFSFISEKDKELFFNTIKQDYWQYNSFVLQNADSFPEMVENTYNNTIKNKGLLLKSNTAMRNAIYSSNDSILMQDYDNWIALKTQIAKKYSKGEDAEILESKADSLEGNLVKNSNEFSDFKNVQNITWKQIQADLKDNEVAIEFTYFPLLNPDSGFFKFNNQTQYVALIITKQGKYPEMIPLFEEKQLEKIIGKFGGNNYSYINSIYGKNNEVNTELYNLIWKPMEGSLKGAEKVYLSPSGLLHKISFSAIAKKQNVYLCDVYDIEIKSTTGKITEQSQGATQSRTLTNATLFGGINYNTDSTKQEIWKYLDGTKTETQEIDEILKKGKVNVNYFTNISASEEEFKLMASNSNILHIATHGFFYPDPKELQKEEKKNIEVGDVVFRGGSRGFGVNSFVENKNPLMRSGLVFAGANDVWSKETENDSIDDGVLTAQEVATIDMRKTDLVVMSACETGLGDIKGSEGVYGLQRAFKMAGVDYLIMSLWQVPDKETEEFMTTFYKKLIKQKDIKKAFAQTQKEMREKYDPYFWAAFVLIE